MLVQPQGPSQLTLCCRQSAHFARNSGFSFQVPELKHRAEGGRSQVVAPAQLTRTTFSTSRNLII